MSSSRKVDVWACYEPVILGFFTFKGRPKGGFINKFRYLGLGRSKYLKFERRLPL